MALWGLAAGFIVSFALLAHAAIAQESSWQPYTPTPPKKKIEAAVVIEADAVEAPGNEFLVRSGFFAPAVRRATEDLANMFARVVPARNGTENYVLRIRMRWDGELHPSIALLDPHGGAQLAAFSRPSSRQLRAVALNLRESMQLLKADLASAFERLPTVTHEPVPSHRDPL